MEFNMSDAYVGQAIGLCDYIDQTSEVIWNACLKAITPDMKGIDAKRIYITGCGDSYCAGIAMESAFTDLLGKGVSCRPVRAIDIARRYAPQRFKDEDGSALVILISASGKPSRVVEGARRASSLGAHTMAITSGTETPLGQVSETCVVVPKPNVPSSPGLLSYVCSELTLAYTAIVMGFVRGQYSIERALEYRKKIEEYCASYRDVIESVAENMKEVAEAFKDADGYDFFADRSDYATAYFAGCKYMELFGGFFTIDDSENWEHVNHFILDTHKMATATVLTHNSPSRSRILEGIPVCKRLERPLLVVTDLAKEDLSVDYGFVCSLPRAEYRWMAPLMMHLPFDFVAFYIAQYKGEPYFRNFEGPWSIPNKIGDSEIIIK